MRHVFFLMITFRTVKLQLETHLKKKKRKSNKYKYKNMGVDF